MKSAGLFAVLTVSLIHVTRAKDNACATATKPDFNAPGRRLSEQKCRLYNWERKNLEKCSSPQDIEVNEHPYMGAIGFKTDDDNAKELRYVCAAFLVSPKFAVTAAHCARGNVNLIPQIIRFGNKNIKANVSRIDAKIKSITTHPKYVPPKKSYDIALLELEHELPLTRAVMPACLWYQPEVSSDNIQEVSAWAIEKREEIETPDSIKTMKVQAIDSKTCLPLVEKYFNRRWQQLEDHHLCANESLSGVHLCYGSAGAPIISSVAVDGEDKMPYAIGITSFGFGCSPGVSIYTRISSFVDWIERTVWNAAQEL